MSEVKLLRSKEKVFISLHISPYIVGFQRTLTHLVVYPHRSLSRTFNLNFTISRSEVFSQLAALSFHLIESNLICFNEKIATKEQIYCRFEESFVVFDFRYVRFRCQPKKFAHKSCRCHLV